MSSAENAVRLDPMWATAHCLAGWARELSGDWETAIASFERARSVVRETGQFGVWCTDLALARLYHLTGRDSEVLPTFLNTELYSDYSDAIRHGWESNGWKGLNQALAEAIVLKGGGPQVMAVISCPYYQLVEAGLRERMYACLEKEMDETASDETVTSVGQTVRRLLLAQIRWAGTFAPYRDEPRFQRLLHRLDQRTREAAGTYEQKVGLVQTP